MSVKETIKLFLGQTLVKRARGRILITYLLGLTDIVSRYRRSKIGPFWITISMGITIGTIGLIFANIFRSPVIQFLPFLSCGLIIWTFIASNISETCNGFIERGSMMRQLPLDPSVYIYSILWRNTIILAHNLMILPVVFLLLGKSPSLTSLLFLPGLGLLIINLAWVGIILGIVCARYRDLPQIISSLLQVAFYLTPIIWMPDLLTGRLSIGFIEINPFFHAIDVVRAPLLGSVPTITNYAVVIIFAVVGWAAALRVKSKFQTKVVYWI